MLEKTNRVNIGIPKTTERRSREKPREKKGEPRIIEDLTILPSRRPLPDPRAEEPNEGWSQIEPRGRRKNRYTDENKESLYRKEERKYINNENRVNQENREKRTRSTSRKRPPRSSAISIKAGEGASYADILRKIKQETALSEYGIENVCIRKTANQSTILEISGVDNATKADALATKFQEIVGDTAKITRPVQKADLRIVGFDKSVLPEEIECAIAEIGDCKIDQVKVGKITSLRNGSCLTIVNCPLSAAIKALNEGKIKVGWTVPKIVLLKPRPLQCFKCWYFGHGSYNCKNQLSRGKACFNCGSAAHTVQLCKANPFCIIRHEHEFAHDHRIGSYMCKAKYLDGPNG